MLASVSNTVIVIIMSVCDYIYFIITQVCSVLFCSVSVCDIIFLNNKHVICMVCVCMCLLIIITYFRYQEIYNGSTDTLEQEVKELTIELNKLDSPLVFCHNDLLCGNVIYNEKEGMIGVIHVVALFIFIF